MNKLAIPAILTATIMVAGMFAFMPVQQANTVHTGIVTDAGKSFRVSQAGALGVAGGVSTYTLTCTEACIVDNISAWATAGDDTDITFIVNANSMVDVLKVALTAPADNAIGDLNVGADISNEVNVLTTIQSRAPAAVDQLTPTIISVGAGGTVVVTVNNSTDGDGDAAVTVVFSGKNLGTTTPTSAFVA